MPVTDRWWGTVGVGNPNTAPAHIGTHIDTLRDSIAGYTTALFANVADRATATADFLAAHSGATGMKGFVVDRGACVYDGNARAGSGGWTWESSETNVVQVAGLSQFQDSATLKDLVSGATYVASHGAFNRRVRVSVSASMQNYGASPLTAPAGCQLRVIRNGGELQEVRLSQVIFNSTYIAVGSSENKVTGTWVYTHTGTSTYALKMLREGGSAGGVQVNSASLMVTDLGPAD